LHSGLCSVDLQPKSIISCIDFVYCTLATGLCHTIDVIQDVSEKYWTSHPVFVSHMWLSTNGVVHCESYNLQAGANSPLTGAKRPVSGRNVLVAKCPGAKHLGGETSWGKTSGEGAKRP